MPNHTLGNINIGYGLAVTPEKVHWLPPRLLPSLIHTLSLQVETIGDAYMVVGGIPNECADHAIQTSDMSLDIMSSVLTFKIRHKPEKQLKVRIGLHSGPAAAGQ